MKTDFKLFNRKEDRPTWFKYNLAGLPQPLLKETPDIDMECQTFCLTAILQAADRPLGNELLLTHCLILKSLG